MSKKKYKNGQFPQLNQQQYHQLKEVYLKAQQFQQQGYLTEAEKLYKEILNFIPQQPDALHYLGLIYMQKGDAGQAESFIRQSIRLSNNPVYFGNYGLFLADKNKHMDAVVQYKKALEIQPVYAECWFNLGRSYSFLGDLPASEHAYKKAIECKHNYIKALYSLACIQEALNKPEQAKETIGRIQIINPVTASDYYTLGMAQQFLGGNENIRKAHENFRKALELSPNSLEIYIALARLLEGGNKIEVALSVYQKILSIEPDYQDVKIKYADCLVKNDQVNEAEQEIQNILKQNPDNVSAQAILGNINMIKGDFSGAESIYANILELDGGNIDALSNMVYCRKFGGINDPFIIKLRDAAKNKKIPLSLYALGKVYNDFGEYDLAFDVYKMANDIKNKRIEYSYIKNSEHTDAIINVFSNQLVSKLQSYGNRSELPVFIVGAPRSGTTLTEQIISAHHLVSGAGELKHIRILASHGVKERITAGERYPQRILTASADELHEEAENYLSKISAYRTNDSIIRITDKMPGNYLFIGYIQVLFPNAKIIHCRRNPVDTCLSIYFQAFHNSHQYSFDLNNLGHWYKDYRRLMEHWDDILGDRILNIEYDDTVNETEKTARKLIEFCGLEWDEKCLEYYKNEREIRTASLWQARQPIYKTSLERWKRYDKHIGVLKEILAGYY